MLAEHCTDKAKLSKTTSHLKLLATIVRGGISNESYIAHDVFNATETLVGRRNIKLESQAVVVGRKVINDQMAERTHYARSFPHSPRKAPPSPKKVLDVLDVCCRHLPTICPGFARPSIARNTKFVAIHQKHK